MANEEPKKQRKYNIGQVFASDRQRLIEEKIKKMGLMAEGKDVDIPNVATSPTGDNPFSRDEDDDDEREKLI
jgi:hypothetical protein